MVFSYEDKNDDATYNFYRISWILVVALGVIGIVFLVNQNIEITLDSLEVISDNVVSIGQVLTILAVAALIVGWLQVGLTAKLGEELVLLITWLSPIAVIATSVFIYLNTQDVNYLGGTVAGVVFLGFVIYFRKSLRLSARLIEVGAEITATNPSLFIPQLTSFIGTTIVTILMFPAITTIGSFTLTIHPILTFIVVAILMFMYAFIVSAFQSYADASNISYIDYWYTKKTDPSLGKAADHVKNMKAPITRFAFLMAFVNRFRRNRSNSKWNPLKLFQLLKFSNWKNVLFRRRSITSTAASVAAYFGSYTLIVMMVENVNSVASAFKKSAESVFERFVENIAGSMGFNILESFRKFFSGVLMLAAGAIYGYTQYNNDIILAIVFALMFLILGFYPLNAMFKPVTNAYRLILYRSHTGTVSKKLDDKTREIIKEVI